MADSIFTKIIRGKIPCYKVYEDDRTFAFLDIEPIQPGHVLVISKKQLYIWDLPDSDYEALMKTVKKVADRISKVLTPNRVGLQVVGVHVPDHAHVHVFPFNNMEKYRQNPRRAQNEELAEMAQKLAF